MNEPKCANSQQEKCTHKFKCLTHPLIKHVHVILFFLIIKLNKVVNLRIFNIKHLKFEGKSA